MLAPQARALNERPYGAVGYWEAGAPGGRPMAAPYGGDDTAGVTRGVEGAAPYGGGRRADVGIHS